MRNLKSYILSLLLVFSFSSIAAAQTGNSIEGRVFTESNAPVYNAYVELYNDIETMIRRERSSSSGRFTFRGIPAGRYIVRVKPFGTNLMEAEERVEIVVLGYAPTTEFVNFRLEVDKRFIGQTDTIIGTIYAQEVPNEAKRLFDSGVKKLKDQNNKGIEDLEAAIKIFPDYFDALNTLGRMYVGQGKYEQGYPLLLKAIDINSRCPECYYSLGVTFYSLNQYEAGVRAAKAAVSLMPNSADSQLLLGILSRLNKNNEEAEKALLEAKKLYKDPNPEVHWQLALLYNNTNRTDKGIEELEIYLKADPNAKNKDEVKKIIKDYRAKNKKEKS